MMLPIGETGTSPKGQAKIAQRCPLKTYPNRQPFTFWKATSAFLRAEGDGALALGISLDKSATGSGTVRAGERHRLHLSIVGKTESLVGFDGVLRDLSTTGFLLETQVALDPARGIEVALPDASLRQARIAWSSGRFHGCRFLQPLTKAAVSAALLRAPSRTGSAPSFASASRSIGESFGARLKRLRTDLSITQADFARSLGVSKPTVWKWETGGTLPRQRRMSDIANLLGTTVIELEHGAQIPDPELETAFSEVSSGALAPINADDLESVTRRCKSQIAHCTGILESQIEILVRC